MSVQTLQKDMLPLANGVQAVFDSNGISYYRHADWLGSSRFGAVQDRQRVCRSGVRALR